jgi:Zn-dependent peptidase ImmA (M78 family)/transcriptional regulator with XRE-family HTH domain
MPHVNHEILQWARETAGLSLEQAVEKLAIGDAGGVAAVDRLAALEAGRKMPSRAQLVNMAKVYRRPLVTFYMSAPPRTGDRGQDFRTLPAHHSKTADALLDALIRDVRARQSIVRSLLEDEEEMKPLPFIGSLRISNGVSKVLASIRDALDLHLESFRQSKSPDDAFDYVRERAENAGIFVLLIGNLGSHHTAIDVETFRGFALADPIAPFIVINDQDSRSAWSFTLLHELAHLWLGATGISGGIGEKPIERFCSDVAGEFLLPKKELVHVGVNHMTDVDTAAQRIAQFAEEHHLSRTMIAYALYRWSKSIDEKTWEKLRTHFREQWRRSREIAHDRSRDREGGPNYYIVKRHRIGSALLHLVQRMMNEGVLTPSKAGKVLGVKPTNVQALIHTTAPTGSERTA